MCFSLDCNVFDLSAFSIVSITFGLDSICGQDYGTAVACVPFCGTVYSIYISLNGMFIKLHCVRVVGRLSSNICQRPLRGWDVTHHSLY